MCFNTFLPIIIQWYLHVKATRGKDKSSICAQTYLLPIKALLSLVQPQFAHQV